LIYKKESLYSNEFLIYFMNSIKKLILQKLIRANIWGGKHIPIDFVLNGIPEHFRRTHQGKKEISKVLKELINNELIIILIKRTGKDSSEHISLNPRKVSEIKSFLENN